MNREREREKQDEAAGEGGGGEGLRWKETETEGGEGRLERESYYNWKRIDFLSADYVKFPISLGK